MSSCSLISLLNSGTAHIKYNVAKANLEGEQYENKSRWGDPSFSIRNVQHPRAWGKWATNIRLTPSIHGTRQTYQTGALKTNGDQLPDLKFRRGSLLANVKWTNHTPIGAFAISYGYGIGVYKLYNEEDINTIRGRPIQKVDLAYIGFLSKRFFFLMGPRYYKQDFEQYVFAIRLGYFWGNIKK
ncbi:MAG: hypothetical protein HN509_03160 [Halobacteriovoraceae bacterium]|jgi:hypothetical protein|nr:hypothetical protein [Halobacteriovoraceae bacterium]